MAELADISKEYFATLNSTAWRIHRDIAGLSDLLGDRWLALSQKERNGLIDNHIVPQEIRNHYGSDREFNDEDRYFPRLVLKCGGSVVQDNDGETWEDEHSSPFSWETRSQNEMSLSDCLTDKPRPHLKDPKRCKSPARAAGAGSNARARISMLQDGSSTGTGFDHLRSMWEQGNFVSPAASDGLADDSGQPVPDVKRTAASDEADSRQRVTKPAVAAHAADDSSSRQQPLASSIFAQHRYEPGAPQIAAEAATSTGKTTASAKASAPSASSFVLRGGDPWETHAAAAAPIQRVSEQRDPAKGSAATGTAGGAALATAASVVATNTMVAKDDPVFVQHGVTFSKQGSAAAPSRGHTDKRLAARPSSGVYVESKVNSSFVDGESADSMKTGFDFLDNW